MKAKKILSLFLAMIMVLGVVAITPVVAQEGEPAVASEPAANAVTAPTPDVTFDFSNNATKDTTNTYNVNKAGSAAIADGVARSNCPKTDGSNNTNHINFNNDMLSSVTNELTVSMLLKFNSLPTSGNQQVYRIWNNGAATEPVLLCLNNAGKLNVRYGWKQNGPETTTITMDTAVKANTWYVVTVSFVETATNTFTGLLSQTDVATKVTNTKTQAGFTDTDCSLDLSEVTTLHHLGRTVDTSFGRVCLYNEQVADEATAAAVADEMIAGYFGTAPVPAVIFDFSKNATKDTTGTYAATGTIANGVASSAGDNSNFVQLNGAVLKSVTNEYSMSMLFKVDTMPTSGNQQVYRLWNGSAEVVLLSLNSSGILNTRYGGANAGTLNMSTAVKANNWYVVTLSFAEADGNITQYFSLTDVGTETTTTVTASYANNGVSLNMSAINSVLNHFGRTQAASFGMVTFDNAKVADEATAVVIANQMIDQYKFAFEAYTSIIPTKDFSLNFDILSNVADNYDSVKVTATCIGDTVELTGTTVGNVVRYTYSKLSAIMMTEEVTVTVEGIKGGEVVDTATFTTSIEAACKDIIAANADANDVAICKALLSYGAWAQAYFQYNIDNLANRSLTDKTVGDVTLESWTSKNTEGFSDNPAVGIAGATVNLKNPLELMFKLASGTDTTTLTAVILDEYGKYVDTATIANGYASYAVSDMREVVYFAVYENFVDAENMGTQVSYAYRYSVESFAASKADSTNNALKTMVKAMMLYNDAVAAANASV